jgi:hypothetical protein
MLYVFPPLPRFDAEERPFPKNMYALAGKETDQARDEKGGLPTRATHHW